MVSHVQISCCSDSQAQGDHASDKAIPEPRFNGNRRHCDVYMRRVSCETCAERLYHLFLTTSANDKDESRIAETALRQSWYCDRVGCDNAETHLVARQMILSRDTLRVQRIFDSTKVDRA